MLWMERFSAHRMAFWVAPVGLIALWWLADACNLLREIPGPDEIAANLLVVAREGAFYTNFTATLGRTLISFTLSAIGGIILGAMIGISGAFGRGLEALIDFLRSIPAPALLPVFMSLFGLYSGPKVALATFVCLLVVTVYTSYGIRAELGSLRTEWLRTIGATRWFTLRTVLLPGAIGSIVTGLRVAFSLSLVLSTLSEIVLMTGAGAGVLIRISYEDGKTSEMYALIFLLGLTGFGLTLAFTAAERFVYRRFNSSLARERLR